MQTIVYRLEAKKALRRVRKISNAHIFEATVSRELTQRRLIDDLLGLFGGRTQPVMAHFIESGKLTLDDIKEAEKLVNALSGRESSNERRVHRSSLAILAVCGLRLAVDLLLRKEGANVRYWIWFAASVKFLMPFSLLATIGSDVQDPADSVCARCAASCRRRWLRRPQLSSRHRPMRIGYGSPSSYGRWAAQHR